MDNPTSAKILIKTLDLTSLDHNDSKEGTKSLYSNCQTKYGNVAAICIYPEFISFIPKGDLKIATVANFPEGNSDYKQVEKEVKKAIKLEADEIDVVLPYQEFLNGNIEFCKDFLYKIRQLCPNKTLKVIIESGVLKSTSNIKKATNLCIDAGADFIKTSTGKTPVSATPEAANAILETIKSSGKDVGFKASGGIKTLEEAKQYLSLAIAIMGIDWINPKHFRIGASSLLADLQEHIEKGY